MSNKYALVLVAVVIFAIGLVLIFSTTSAEVLDHDLEKSTHQAPLRQVYYGLAGVVLACGVCRLGYKNILDWSPILLSIFTVLLILVLIPGIGKEVNGSKRWLNLAGLSFQPSEFVKFLVPAFFINRIEKLSNSSIQFKDFLKIILFLAVPIILIMVEPNNGTSAVICVTIVVLCLLTGIPFKYWAWPLLAFILVGGAFALNLSYVSARLKVYLNPELDLKGKGHQPYQAKIAAGSGKLFGKGPGKSLQKLSYLPEAQNDYIAAIYAEEFGFIGIILLISLYTALGYLGFSMASRATSVSALYLAGSITFLICFQAFLNLGVVSGLLPSTGLNLPFFSQGGSSLMANIAGLAFILTSESYPHKDYSLIN